MPEKQTNPVAPKNQETSPEGKQDAPADGGEETVTLPKKEAEALQALKARQSELTKREIAVKQKEQRLSKIKIKKAEPQFTFEEPEEYEPSEAEQTQAIEREVLNVERGIFQMIKSGKYDKLLEKDSTLKEQLMENPLGLSIFAREIPRDAEDALNKIEENLSIKLETLEAQEKKQEKIEEEPAPKVGVGPTNPPVEEKGIGVKPVKSADRLKTSDEVAEDFTKRLMGTL